MIKLILIGGGGHCKSCIDVINAEGKYHIEGILDAQEKLGEKVLDYNVIGSDSDIELYIKKGCSFLITIGQIDNAQRRKDIFATLMRLNANLATIRSPNAIIAPNVKVGIGTIVLHGSIINTSAIVGENCIINSHSLVEHDTYVGDHCHISTGAILNGNVYVGDNSFIGSGSVVVQGANIEKGSFVKANDLIVGKNNKKKKKIAFATTIFPINNRYVDDFMISLVSQSESDFQLVLLNDNYSHIDRLSAIYPEINIVEIKSNSGNSIAKNRESLINHLLIEDYDYVIFGDVDDYFSSNRVAKSIEYLAKFDIVVNDYTSFDDSGIKERKYITNRISNKSKIDIFDILDKNIFGMSNTAINLNSIDLESITFDDDLIAVDWFFYSYLLSLGLNAIFVNDMETYYRQHESNIIGSNNESKKYILKCNKIKEFHYSEMKKVSNKYTKILNDFNENTKSIESCDILYPLWWEASNLERKK